MEKPQLKNNKWKIVKFSIIKIEYNKELNESLNLLEPVYKIRFYIRKVRGGVCRLTINGIYSLYNPISREVFQRYLHSSRRTEVL